MMFILIIIILTEFSLNKHDFSEELLAISHLKIQTTDIINVFPKKGVKTVVHGL